MNNISSFQELVEKIISHDELAEYAFAGNCFNMAVALHRFYPQSTIVVAFNKALYEHKNQFIGHCAIEVENHLIDGDGVIDKDDFLAWGMLDEDDTHHLMGTKISAYQWKTLSYEASKKTLTEDDLDDYIDESVIEKILSILNS